ncbi:MAG: DUF1465 family protein [Sphingomonadales bacterium]
MTGESTNIESFVSVTYRETVAMIEEMTDYLVRRAERDRQTLPDSASAAFAGESIRLTTRLVQVMAWLLNQRAVQANEISTEQARRPRRRLGNISVCLGRPCTGAELLPFELQDMLDRSEDLFLRVLRLDRLLLAAPGENPVHDLIRDLNSGISKPKPEGGGS